MWARMVSGIIGIFMLFNALNWIIDPGAAAESLSMSLLEGKGGNTQIGDFTSFFFTAGLMACIGAYRNEHVWLYATISLLGSAALFRTYAGLVHGADFLTMAIYAEIIMSALLVLSVYLMKKADS